MARHPVLSLFPPIGSPHRKHRRAGYPRGRTCEVPHGLRSFCAPRETQMRRVRPTGNQSMRAACEIKARISVVVAHWRASCTDR